MTTPTKENYLDRYIPSRANAKWKNPPFEVSQCLFQSSSSQSSSSNLFRQDDATSLISDNNAAASLQRGLSNSNSSASIHRNNSDSVLTDGPPQLAIVSALVHNELDENNSDSQQSLVGTPTNDTTILAPRENLNMFSVSYIVLFVYLSSCFLPSMSNSFLFSLRLEKKARVN